MPLVAAGAILSHIMEYVCDSQRCLLTQHYRLTTPSTGSVDGVLVANAVDAEDRSAFNFDATFAGALSNNVGIAQRRLQWIYPTRYVVYTYTPAETEGTVEGFNLPPAVASAITLRPEVAIKGKISTKHMGGVPSEWVSGGTLAPDAITAYEALAADMIQPYSLTVSGSPVELVPIMYDRAVQANSLQVVQYSVQTTSRTERRRVVGRGI